MEFFIFVFYRQSNAGFARKWSVISG